MTYYTRHTQTAALHYAGFDVSSDYSDDSLTYHIYMASPLYGSVDVPSDYCD
jgi:hypothetical protein